MADLPPEISPPPEPAEPTTDQLEVRALTPPPEDPFAAVSQVPLLPTGESTERLTAVPVPEWDDWETEPTPIDLPAPRPELVRQCAALLERGLPAAVAAEALGALERTCERAVDRAVVQRSLARIHEDAGDRDRAFFALVRCARMAVADRELLDELFRLATLTGHWAELAAAYEEALAGPLSRADRIYLHLKLGHVHGRQLGRPQVALRHYRRVLTVDATNIEALRRLAELLAGEERWAEVVLVRRQELEAVSATTADLSEMAAIARELARLHEEHLADPRGALDCWQALLTLVPESAAAGAGLERLASGADGVADDALELLRAHLEESGAWVRLAGVVSTAAQARLRAGKALAAVALHAAAARVHEEHLADGDRAFVELVRALQVLPAAAEGLDPGEVDRAAAGVLDELFRLGRSGANQTQLAAIAEDLALRLGGERGAAILVRIAEAELEDPEASARAASRLARAVELAGDNPGLEARLEGLYVSRGAWRDLAAFYRARAERAQDVKVRGELRFRLAELLEDELGDREAAAEVYRTIIDESGGHRAALAALSRLLEEKRDWRALVEALERAVDVAASLEEKKAALLKRAEVSLARLEDPLAARQDWQRVLALDPGCVEALEGLADTAREEGDARETARALELSLAGLRPGDRARPDGYRRLARLYGDHLQQPARARMAWEEVLAEAPTDPEAFARLRALYHQREDHDSLLRLLRGRLDLEPRHADSRFWRRELIEALERLGRGEEAAEEWRRAVKEDPSDVEARSRLSLHHTAHQDWPALVATLREWISACASRAEKAELHARIGTVERQELGDPAAARSSFEKALSLSPDHVQAQLALLELLRGGGEDDKAFPLMLRRLARVTDPRERQTALREIWETGSRLGEAGDAEAAARATAALKDLCLVAPEDDALWAALQGRLSAADQWAELAGHLEARATRLEGARQAQALLEAASAFAHGSGPGDARVGERVRRCLERARDAAPADHPAGVRALQRLRDIYALSGAWEALAGVLEALCDPLRTPDPEVQAALHEDLAWILDHRLGRVQHAAEWLARLAALPAEPATREARLRRLGEVKAREGAWSEVAGLLETRIELVRGRPEEVALRLELAQIAERRLSDVDLAIVQLRAAAALRPGEEEVLARLEQVCSGARRQGELRGALLAGAEGLEGGLRASLLLRAASVESSELDDLPAARQHLEAALAVPGIEGDVALEAQRALAGVLRAQGAFPELAALAARLAAEAADPGARAEWNLTLAVLHETQLPDPERARRCYEQALAEAPGHTLALEGVARFAERGGRLEEALALRHRQAGQEQGERAARAFCEAARLEEELGRPEAAETDYGRALEASPEALVPRRALLRLMRARGARGPRLELARFLAGATDDADERAALWSEVGELLDLQGEGDAAALAYERALEARPGRPDAAAALARHLLARGEASAALALLESVVGRLLPELDRERLADLHEHAARAASLAGREDTAVRHLEEAVHLAPAALGTLERIAAQFEERGETARAIEVLDRICEGHDDALDGEARVDLRRRICGHLLRAGRIDEAVRVAQETLVLAPDDPDALEDAARAFEQAGRWADAAYARERLLSHLSGPEDRRRVFMAIAGIWAERLHDAVRALRILELARGELPSDPEILERLALEQERSGAWSGAAESLVRRLALATEPPDRVRLLTRLGALQLERLDAPEAAAGSYRAALDEAGAPSELEAVLVGLRELAAHARDPAPLVEALRKLATGGSAWPGEIAARRELSEILRWQVGDRAAAIRELEAIERLDPEDLEASADLARLYEREGRYEEALAVFERVLDLSPFDVEAHRALVRLLQREGDVESAALCASLVGILGESDEALSELAARLDDPPPARTALELEARAHELFHPGVRTGLGEVMAALGQEGVVALLEPRAAPGAPFTTDSGPWAGEVAEALLLAVRTLALPPVDLRLGGPGQVPIFLALSAPRPTLAVAPELLRGERVLDLPTLRFLAARALVGVMPEHWGARVLHGGAMTALLQGARVAVGEAAPLDRAGERLARRLEKALPPSRLGVLRQAVTAWQSGDGHGDAASFTDAVEQSATRAGLLLCGNPAAAVRALRTEGEVGRNVLRELFRFTVSRAHRRLRQRLGLTR